MAAPVGNQNASRARKWRNAIERALEHWPEKPPNPLESERGLNEAAFLFVSEMMGKKDLGFFREFGDRLDGKPAQAIVGGDEGDNPIQVATRVELVGLK